MMKSVAALLAGLAVVAQPACAHGQPVPAYIAMPPGVVMYLQPRTPYGPPPSAFQPAPLYGAQPYAGAAPPASLVYGPYIDANAPQPAQPMPQPHPHHRQGGPR